MSAPFADRLIERARARQAPLCVGLDPYPERIPLLFGRGLQAIEDFCLEILAAAAPRAVAVKPQAALFEAFGWEGVRLAQRLAQEAGAGGMLVLLDAKRGDIGATSAGYAAAALGPPPAYDADCVTVSPYMGADSLAPFLDIAERRAKGVAVLVRTSNPGARDLQDLPAGADGTPLWEHTARLVARETHRLRGDCGWSGLMAVIGATAPAEARRARALLPEALFLVPGYGAQGASAEDAVAGFRPGPAGLEGGLVNSSRAILYGEAAQRASTLQDWRAALVNAMDAAVKELYMAVRRGHAEA